MNTIRLKPDTLGAFTSALCIIHCAITPFIFIAQTCRSSCCDSAPIWWQAIDYIFLFISLLIVYKSTNQSTRTVLKYALWISWFSLFITLINEKIELITLPQILRHLCALSLMIFHIYNQR
jgi:hypothetical protein